MRAEQLPTLFNGEVAPGVYRITVRVPAEVIAALAETYGWRLFLLDGTTIRDKHSLLHASASAMNFPSYFGFNWDAFEECLRDLSWAPARGYLILYEDAANFARHAPQEWATTLDIFKETVTSWQGSGIPMFVLLRRTGGRVNQLPVL